MGGGISPKGVQAPVQDLECQPRCLSPSQVERGEEEERGGVPKGRVLAIASKVGLEEGSLGTSKEGSNLQLMTLLRHCGRGGGPPEQGTCSMLSTKVPPRAKSLLR